jgi:hypothetical protein
MARSELVTPPVHVAFDRSVSLDKLLHVPVRRLTIDLQLVQSDPTLLFDDVQDGSSLVTNSFQGRSSDMRGGTVLRQTDDHSSSIRVPVTEAL